MTSIDDDVDPFSPAAEGDVEERGGEGRASRFASARDAAEEGPHPYFMELEDLLIRLRARATTVPPADWQLARKWYLAGIPLAFLERTLEELFVQRAQAGKEGIQSLRFARRKVERAWEELQRLQAPAAGRPAEDDGAVDEPEADLAERLGELAERLPETLTNRERWSEEIVALASLEELAEIEDALTALEERLLGAVDSALDETARHELDERLDVTLAPLRERLEGAQLALTERRLRQRLLREQMELPVLSLFAD